MDTHHTIVINLDGRLLARVLARELAILYVTALLAAVVLFLAEAIGIDFLWQTYFWTFAVLYNVRVLAFVVGALTGRRR